MQLFLSTTFFGTTATDVEKVLRLLDGLSIDGVEIGSTHIHRLDIEDIVCSQWNKRIVTHNFFPPTEDQDFVMNIASENSEIRTLSVNHAAYCIKVASDIGAEVYTIHPGFMADADLCRKNSKTYDFNFGLKRVGREIAFNSMLESISELISIASQYNIKLAIETEGSLTEPNVLLMETIDEYDQLFSKFPEGIYLNLNLAHARFAADEHGYRVDEFIRRYYEYICLVEISHNNGEVDQHQPLVGNSYVFDYLSLLPDVPYILEFRNSSIEQIRSSMQLMRDFVKKG